MHTSKIKIRPFKPCLKDETVEGREPFAILKYGNVEVELDYTILNFFKLDCKNTVWTKTQALANAGIQEIIKEMDYVMSGNLPTLHRDGSHPYLGSIANNPLHPINTENICIEDVN